ncbi:MAG: hypothetical protein PHH30_08965 [Bacteroidales bacterium]|nr:hypothetical protein [Bacteroidales bacterium]
MKKILLFVMTCFFITSYYAQPSETVMINKIKSSNTSGNLLNVELLGSGTSEKVFEDNAWHTYYRRSYKTKSKTDYPGIFFIYFGSIQYELVGGAYQYDRMLVGEWHYEGVPDPNKEEILALLNSDLIKYLGRNTYNDIVGDLSEITFPDDVKFHWHELTSVSFLTNVTYSEKISYTEVRKAEHTIEVRLYADEFKGPWKSFLSTKKDDGSTKNSGEIIKYTAEEMAQMKTLSELDEENAAKAYTSSLPEVEEIPSFESDKQLFYYVHEIIMTKPTEEVKAYLFKMLEKSCFEDNSTVLLKSWAQKWYDNIGSNHQAYINAHCLYPTVKAYQSGMITFYDRENTRMLRIVGVEQDGTFKLREIAFYPASSTDIERMKNNDNNCGEKPDLTVRKIMSYEIGDKVIGKFSNGDFPGSIENIDPYNPDRYYFKLESNGKGYWMDEVNLMPNDNPKESEIKSDNNTDNNTEEPTNTETVFNVGDKVIVNSNQGKKKGKIIKYASNKYLVKFIDPRYGDTWVSKANLEKE